MIAENAIFVLMRPDEHQKLQTTLGRGTSLLDEFLAEINATEDHCIYLVSCLQSRFLFVDDSFEKITGHPAQSLLTSGLDFLIPQIHPEDRPTVMDRIIQGYKSITDVSFVAIGLKPITLEYRFRRADGEWIWLQELKWIVPGEDTKDLILGALHDVTARYREDEEKLRLLNEQPDGCNKLLKVALDYRESQKKQWLNSASPDNTTKSEKLNLLTKREKEILQLVGEGLSTKQIADKLFISINTVETHRRHLLEKLDVKNSMELIKEASKGFWL